MEKYFKLRLDNCEYWQSRVDENGKKEYKKMIHQENEDDLLNEIFLKKILDSTYMELYTKKLIEFIDGYSISPKGITIPLSNITPCILLEVIKSYKNIDKNGLTEKYKKVLNDLLINSEYCQLVADKKEKSLSLRRY